jgi:hypothetical protein
MTHSRGIFSPPRMILFAILLFSVLSPLAAQDKGTGETPFIQIIPRFEYGLVGVLSHVYRSGAGEVSGTGGTTFNFVTMGGQDTLFPYQRYSAEIVLGGRNRVTLLYQPLTLNTRTVAGRNGTPAPVFIDDATFPADTPIDITYGFDFWRVSWLYDFARSPRTILGAGVSLQIRNASIVFTSGDGTERSANQNIGPVPILKARAAHWFSPRFGLDFEADGFYASSAIFNGSGNPFEGWIWDAALSAKTRFMANTSAFLTVRSIGGGARGSNAYSYRSATTSVNPETFNALATLAVTLGVSVE